MAKQYPKGFLDDFEVTAYVEGGYTDNPADPGGATFTGVTLRTYNRYFQARARKAGREYIRATKDDMKAQLLENPSVVKDIFLNMYWRKVKASRIHPASRLMLYDAMVLGGVRGIKTIQGVLRIKRDGVVGPQTLAALKARTVDKNTLSEFAIDCRNARLQYLSTRKHWVVFGKGWTARLDYVLEKCLRRVNASSNIPDDLRPPAPSPVHTEPEPEPEPEPVQAATAPRGNFIVRLFRRLFR